MKTIFSEAETVETLKSLDIEPGEVFVFPLSFAQRQLWFLEQLEPGTPFYTLPMVLKLAGRIEIGVLERSLNELVRRHEALRTNLAVIDGEPVQAIAPHLTLELPVIDLQGFPLEQREAEAERLANEEAQTPFILSQSALIRVKIVRLTEIEHILMLTMHHAIADGWSMGILLKELAAIYTAFSCDRPSPLPELTLQYADFSLWQQERWQGEVLERQLSYWKEQLAEISPLQLPTPKPRPPVASFRGATKSWHLPPDLSQALQALSQQEEVTLFMLLLAAFQTLLYRYTQQEDIVVGTAIANRNRAETENIVGLFVNTLPLRVIIAGNPTFRELLQQVRRTTLDAYDRQDLPFEKLVEELQPERDLSRNPLFQVWFALHNQPMPSLQLGDVKLTPMEVESGTAQFDLSLDVFIQESGLVCAIEYSTDLFSEEVIARFQGHFQTLLAGIVANPAARISDLPLLTLSERERLLENAANTSNYPVEDESIHGLFAKQVELTPDVVAVVCGVERVTYAQLNQKADLIAAYLYSLGVGTESLVGVYLERSIEAIASILGILKAGGAYVPLDPSHPEARISLILEDTQAPVILTQRHLLLNLPQSSTRKVCLEDLINPLSPIPNPQSLIPNLAYVIYTSGSTGKPKGVACTHLGVLNLLADFEERQPLNVGNNCSWWTNLSFDVSIYEIFSSLLSGGTLNIVPEDLRADSEGLLAWLRDRQIESAYLPPFSLTTLADWLKNTSFTLPLKRLLVGVEAIPEETLRAIASHLPHLHIINGYGPTEATICTTLYSLSSESESDLFAFNNPKSKIQNPKSTSIGIPVRHTQIYLLDPNLQLVPSGIPGEVYIGGVGLARGYLNRPDLTSDRFIPNPYSWEPGARLYKTGDLARYLDDGNLEFIGRTDYQVKIRGYRLELGEIEAVLRQHPAVRDAVVVARDRQLIAYAVPNLEPDRVETEYISQLQAVYDQFYSWQFSDLDPAINLRIWTTRYTNLPLPIPEILECVSNTVERILALQPQCILEIGCGTGLLLSRIAPHCQHYCGIDISDVALQHLRQHLTERQPELLPQISLHCSTATNLSAVKNEQFDAIILNEIVQNFPRIEYLIETIESVLPLVRSGGYIFMGGIRNLQLLTAFHAGVLLESRPLPDEANLDAIKQYLQQQKEAENELVIHPDFFTALQQQLPQISGVQIQLKGGKYRNELTKFKYDVTLQIGGETAPKTDIKWLDWGKDNLTLEGLSQFIVETKPEALGVAQVPSDRLVPELTALQILRDTDFKGNLGELRALVNDYDAREAIAPQAFWLLAQTLPYNVWVSWSDSGENGCYDVVFSDKSQVVERRSTAFKERRSTATSLQSPLSPQYSNKPLQLKTDFKLTGQLRQFLAQKLPEYAIPSVFTILPALPLTPNGKVDRKALPAPEVAKRDTELKLPQSEMETALAKIWQEVLGLERVGINDNFFELGGDSILSIQVVSQAKQRGLQVTPKQLFQYQTIAELAAVVETKVTTQPQQELIAGSVPLIPIQHWFFQQSSLYCHHYNQANLLIAQQQIDPVLLKQAVQELLIHHDGLRSRFKPATSGWQQYIVAPYALAPVEVIELGNLPPADRETAIEAIAEQTQASFQLAAGYLIKVVLFDLGKNNPQHLLIVIHHLVIDGVSWQILLEDFQSAYTQLQAGQKVALPLKTTSVKEWSVILQEYAQSDRIKAELNYWIDGVPRSIAPLPLDLSEGQNTVASAKTRSISLTVAETQALARNLPANYGTQIDEVLLTAVGMVFAKWTDSKSLLIDLEGHGREHLWESIDLSRTVGWFTSLFPICLDLKRINDAIATLKSVKEQMRGIPHRGIGYGILRYLSSPEIREKLGELPNAEMSFNYLGRVDALLERSALVSATSEATGAVHHPASLRPYLLEIDCFIADDRLQIDLTYSQNRHQANTVQKLAQDVVLTLRSLIDLSQSADAGDYTPSDFKAAKMSQKDLQKLLKKV
ncbi:non-ribosomal peptide synthetase [Merismopedia glauca]|uniref:Non-ribosomal peptide synthetase n=1 Tax=Merismopedia glauca CCAP 1448/3 TaxID=1296344 RepID=A0A2T1BZA0_9CYAN|nr:non-ribosomal peptide synthetase [Merismopedia glauca]PSB01238.1 non-ribosomal peptide synthetase [Merismopedia glauca CCAP 1448/3]